MRCPTCGATDQVSRGYDSRFYCWECSTAFSRRLLKKVNAKNAAIFVPVAVAAGVVAISVGPVLGLCGWIKNKVSPKKRRKRTTSHQKRKVSRLSKGG
jgi:hypothetical protein